MFKKIETRWSDGLEPGDRRPRLLVAVPGGKVARFAGVDVPGVLAITGSSYNKNGKWSSTTFTLRLAPGCAAVESLTALHQSPLDQFENWAEVAEEFSRVAGQPVDATFLAIALTAEYRTAGEALDAREAAVAALAAPAPKRAGCRWLLNAFSLSMVHLPATVRCREVSLDEAIGLASGCSVLGVHGLCPPAASAVGHVGTARVFAELLATPVACNRVTVALAPGEMALVGQLAGPRLPEGATALPEGATIRWIVVEVA